MIRYRLRLSVETSSLSVYVARPPSLQHLAPIYTLQPVVTMDCQRRRPREYRRVQRPVASISAGQTRSLRPENCLAFCISISRARCIPQCPWRHTNAPPTSTISPSHGYLRAVSIAAARCSCGANLWHRMRDKSYSSRCYPSLTALLLML